MKQYDYYLIIWHDGNDRIHQPMPFDVGVNPVGYCEGVIGMQKSLNTFNPTGYEIKKLSICE